MPEPVFVIVTTTWPSPPNSQVNSGFSNSSAWSEAHELSVSAPEPPHVGRGPTTIEPASGSIGTPASTGALPALLDDAPPAVVLATTPIRGVTLRRDSHGEARRAPVR
ncbi:MAG TPA: hypothetical protein VIK01_11670 [Polyangiaceae bacterium]